MHGRPWKDHPSDNLLRLPSISEGSVVADFVKQNKCSIFTHVSWELHLNLRANL